MASLPDFNCLASNRSISLKSSSVNRYLAPQNSLKMLAKRHAMARVVSCPGVCIVAQTTAIWPLSAAYW